MRGGTMARFSIRDHVAVTKELKVRMAGLRETHQMWLPGLLTITTPDLEYVSYDHFGSEHALNANWKQEGLSYVRYHCQFLRPRLSRYLDHPHGTRSWHPQPTVRSNNVALGYFSETAALITDDSEGYNFGEFYLIAHLRAIREISKDSAVRILTLAKNTVFSSIADKRLTFLDID